MNRITNKIIAVVVAFISFSASVAYPAKAFAPPKHENKTCNGFTVKNVSEFDAFDAQITVYEHERTGADVVFIKNDDPEKSFMLEFETPGKNNKGTAHVFEHSAMNGSVKYPSRSLTMAVLSRSYVSYMNALTLENCTIFPIASLSEKQLLKYADLYADLTFEPLILEDEDIFRSEAWRYSLEDPDGEITINGTIYSEMMGSYTTEDEATHKAMGIIYPGCSHSYEHGGIPEDIIKLTYDEVKDYHRKYYTPANCTAYIYGDIEDTDAFLELLDQYFDTFDRKGEKDAGKDIKEHHGYDEKYCDLPAPASSSGKNGSTAVYAFGPGSVSDDELVKLYAFAKSCDGDHSTPKRTLKSMFPGAKFEISVLADAGRAALTVMASGIDKEDVPRFKDAVEKVFSDMADAGVSDEELDYYRKRMESEVALSREGENAPVNLLMSMANYHSGGRGLLFYTQMRDTVADMKWFDNDAIKDICRRYLTDTDNSAMAVATEKPGLLEENEEKLEKMLDSRLKSMSEAEKKKMIDDTERCVEKTHDDPTEYLEELCVINVPDLSDETKHYDVSDSTDGSGIRNISVYTDADDIDATRIYLDASDIPDDMAGYLALYVNLVNGSFLSTREHKRGEIPYLIAGCTGSGQVISVDHSEWGDNRPYVTVDFTSLPDSLSDAYDLVYERLFESKLDDTDVIREGIISSINVTERNIRNNPDNIACVLARSDASAAAYYDRTHYLGYHDFLEEVLKDIDKDGKAVTAKLEEVREYLNNSNGMIIGRAISCDNEKEYSKCADRFARKLDNKDREKTEHKSSGYKYPLVINEGSGVVSNAIGTGNATKLGLTNETAADRVAFSLIIDRYLRPMTRDKYGAYACSYMERFPSVALFTGMDPNTDETFETFANMGKAWKKIRTDLTQEDVDGYLITIYSAESKSSGKIADAMSVVSSVAMGKGSDRRSERLSQLKALKVSDLAKYDNFFEKLATEGNRVTFAK